MLQDTVDDTEDWIEGVRSYLDSLPEEGAEVAVEIPENTLDGRGDVITDASELTPSAGPDGKGAAAIFLLMWSLEVFVAAVSSRHLFAIHHNRMAFESN